MRLALLRAALAATPLLAAAGCNIVGAAALITQGPPKVSARFTLPKARPTVVFVDDPRSHLPRVNLREAAAGSCGQRLLDAGALDTVLAPRGAIVVAQSERHGEPLDMVTLTTRAKAEVMIWIGVDEFVRSPDGATYQPTARVRVKVIDATAAQPRLWPPEPEGAPLLVQIPVSARGAPRTPAELSMGETALAEFVGRSVAELFFDHERARLGDSRP